MPAAGVAGIAPRRSRLPIGQAGSCSDPDDAGGHIPHLSENDQPIAGTGIQLP